MKQCNQPIQSRATQCGQKTERSKAAEAEEARRRAVWQNLMLDLELFSP